METAAAYREETRIGCPGDFPSTVGGFAPAYWVIPPPLLSALRGQADRASRSSALPRLFYRFKSGERNLAYPLALGIYHALRKRRLLEFDCIVPIPLSPDKAAKNEIHRTRLLAEELAPLLDAPVDELLTLTKPISKRRLRIQQGLTANQFERQYYETLVGRSARELVRASALARRCVHGRQHRPVRGSDDPAI